MPVPSILSRAFARWRRPLARTAPAAPPPAFLPLAHVETQAPATALTADARTSRHPDPGALGVRQSPAPVGPPKGSLVAVSVYLPGLQSLDPVIGALTRLGYTSLELRHAKHEYTQGRVSATARVPVLDLSEAQVVAAVVSELGVAPARAPRIDAQVWPTY